MLPAYLNMDHSKLVTIEEPTTPEELLVLFEDGIEKRVSIIYRPFAGDELFLYDHRLRLIEYPLALYEAERVIVSNIRREPKVPFEGHLLLDKDLLIHGLPSLGNGQVKLQNDNGEQSHLFEDEHSFFTYGHLNTKEGEDAATVALNFNPTKIYIS